MARHLLLDAAFASLVEDGPALSAAAVARRAGLSKALVFHHFDSREGLLDAMAERVLSETQAGLDRLALDHPNPRDRLDALARTLLEEPPPGTTRREARRVLLFWLADDATGAPRARFRDALIADFVEKTVREGATLGVLKRGADPARIADALLAAWHGATTLHATGARVVDFEREAERLVAALSALSAEW